MLRDIIVVASPGFEPGALGYEPSKLPLLYDAILRTEEATGFSGGSGPSDVSEPGVGRNP